MLVAKRDSEEAVILARKVYEILLKMNIEILVERELAWKMMLEKGFSIRNVDVDMIITIGGDGTVLKVANEVKEKEIPILTINAGTIGFLSEINKEEIENKLPRILMGQYTIKECTRIKARIISFPMMKQTINNIEGIYPTIDALNELSIITSTPVKVLNLSVKRFEEEVFRGRCDGLIISTTTGSTAYALSSGGPIIDPLLDVFVIVALSPLKLYQRPVILSSDSKIKVEVLEDGAEALISADGRDYIHLPIGAKLLIEKSEFKTKLICAEKDNFYRKLKSRILMNI